MDLIILFLPKKILIINMNQGAGKISHLRKITTHIFLYFDMVMVYIEKNYLFFITARTKLVCSHSKSHCTKNIVCSLRAIFSPTVHNNSLCYESSLFTKHIIYLPYMNSLLLLWLKTDWQNILYCTGIMHILSILM